MTRSEWISIVLQNTSTPLIRGWRLYWIGIDRRREWYRPGGGEETREAVGEVWNSERYDTHELNSSESQGWLRGKSQWKAECEWISTSILAQARRDLQHRCGFTASRHRWNCDTMPTWYGVNDSLLLGRWRRQHACCLSAYLPICLSVCLYCNYYCYCYCELLLFNPR